MSRFDLAKRLSQMVIAADDDGATQQTTIARRHAANEMLHSGNFFVAQRDALKSLYENTLVAMADYRG